MMKKNLLIRKGFVYAIPFILFLLTFILTKYSINFMTKQVKGLDITIFTSSVTESINMFFIVNVYIYFFIVLPFLLLLFYYYYKDALYKWEKRIILMSYFSLLFGFIGAFFGYWVSIHIFIPFMFSYNALLGIDNFTSLYNIVLFIFNNMILFFMIFQIPFVIRILIRFDIVNKQQLKEYRKYFFFIALFISALFTPTDPISMFVMAIPSQILYEIALIK